MPQELWDFWIFRIPQQPIGGFFYMSSSVHDRLSRVRKPRVHLTYKVETGGAMVDRELPFVVGVLGDFSGDPTKKLPALKDRKFIEIDRDNFNDIMARMTPAVNMKVENTLKGDGSEIPVSLTFNSIEDFEPANVVQQVEPLRKLKETRDRLRDMLTKVDRSDDLEAVLEQILQNSDDQKKLQDALAKGAEGAEGSKS
jgi:type VI secretion system protein ImpB